MKSYWFLPICACLAGCLASNGLEYEAVSEKNVYRIARTRKGMSESQVLRIMHKPYSYETFQVDDDVYDVWFYVTRTTGLDQTRMVAQNLTPLTFKNGVLVGFGYSWYYYAMREQTKEREAQEEACNPPLPKPPTQQEEDREFEKLLRQPAPKLPAEESKPACKGKPMTMLFLSNQVAGLNWSPTPMGAMKKQQLSQVHIGMTETEVTNLLGAPPSYETYTIRNDVYDVWFYEVMDRSGHLTYIPLTFKNSTLAGTSDRYYQKIKAEGSPSSLNGYDRSSDRMVEDEGEQNFDFW